MWELMCLDYLFLREPRFSWFFMCWLILNWISCFQILSLFKHAFENVDFFILARNGPDSSQGICVLPSSIGSLNVSAVFKTVAKLFKSVPHVYHQWQTGKGRNLSGNSVFKVLIMLIKIRSRHAQFGSTPLSYWTN